MSQVDRAGAFIATITEAGYSETKKGFPQFVAKFVATKRYVVEKSEMAALTPPITEAGWVDWNYGDELVGYLVLFNDSGPLKNFEQIQLATGWTGTDFQDLATLSGKSVLIRVEENTWNDKTSLQVTWIDAPDASPERSIKQADAPTIAAANSKWLAGRKAPPKPTVAAALPKPAVAKPAAPAASAVAPPATAVPAAAAPAPTTTSAAPSTPKNPPGRKPKATVEVPVAATGCTLAEAWEAVSSESARGKVELTEVEDMWITHLNVIAKDVPDDKVTPEQYAATRDAVLAEIATKNGK
jgi:hypothetical protein